MATTDIKLVTFTEARGRGTGARGTRGDFRTTGYGFDGARWVRIPVRVAYALQARGMDVHAGYAGPEAVADGWPHKTA